MFTIYPWCHVTFTWWCPWCEFKNCWFNIKTTYPRGYEYEIVNMRWLFRVDALKYICFSCYKMYHHTISCDLCNMYHCNSRHELVSFRLHLMQSFMTKSNWFPETQPLVQKLKMNMNFSSVCPREYKSTLMFHKHISKDMLNTWWHDKRH